MKKIPTLFQRDPEDRSHVIDAVSPGCEWVLAGEGTPTTQQSGLLLSAQSTPCLPWRSSNEQPISSPLPTQRRSKTSTLCGTRSENEWRSISHD